MKNFKKIMGIILVVCLVITQFPITGNKVAKAATETKTDITSSKLSFTYEKTGEGEVTGFTFYDTEVNGFNGNGEYEIEHAEWMYNNTEKGNGYENIGYFKSDAGYVLKNITLVVNGIYEFILEEEKYSWYSEDEKTNKVDLASIWGGYKEGDVVYTSKDKKATLVFDGTLISLNVSNKTDDTETPGDNDNQTPGGDDNKPQEPDNTKTDITSSKLSFTYEKTGEGEVTGFTFYDTEVNGFNGNGDYEIEHAEWMYNNTEKGNGYENIGYFKSDAGYVLKNITLVVNGIYEFILEEEKYSWYSEDEKTNKVDLASIWGGYKEGDVVYTSKDKKATLVFDGTLISLNVSNKTDDTETPGGDDNQKPGDNDNQNPGGDDNKPQEPDNTKTDITSSKLSFTYEKTGEGEVTEFKFYDTDVNGFNGNGDYEIEHAEWMYNNTEKGNGYENIGYFKSDAGYVLKNIILTINGTYEFLLEEEKYSYYSEGEKANKADLANIWGGYKEDEIIYTSKDGKATLVFDGTLIYLHVSNKTDDSDNTGSGDDNQKPGDNDNQKPGGDDTQKPDRVQVNIKSSKLSFTYEKTGETDATFLKVSGTDVNGFKGNGAYEIDIAESAWNTWDKTGYYNLGFVSSDAAYTLKNVIVTVNNTYEFVLEETKAASYNEEEKVYKVDFINMWSGHKEGDVLYTSKDGKAVLVSGGNTAVISLMVDKDAAPTLKPFLPPYAVSSPTTAPVTTAAPTVTPTTAPTVAPTAVPTTNPTTVPTAPTAVPTIAPTTVPTVVPVATVAPTKEPVTAPSSKPEEPSNKPDGANDVQKGDKVTISGQKYEVTNNSKKTVAYVAVKSSKKSVSVPATVKVKVNGKKVTYKVTSIKDKAFKDNKKIKTVTVSKNITSIGKDAFKNCGKLKTIVIKSTNITKVGKDALKGTAKNLVIKVPAGKVSAYKKLFKNKGNNSVIIKKA